MSGFDSHPSDETASTPGGQPSHDPLTQTLQDRDRPGAKDRLQQIGPFQILDMLGEGGMGFVYLAEQHKPIHRRVALKLIKPGMDSRQVLARFSLEREALALLNHPSIAKVFDAGEADDGRPYFAMEYVAGAPITKYCDTNRLTTQDRVTLLITVCEALHHAHQRGIVHRDVKPSNVLVTLQDERPVPKIIDFGVAKALQHSLTDGSFVTQFGQWVGTPGYMSPEQAGATQTDVDARTDVYAAGVLMYELFVGRPPFEVRALHDLGVGDLQRVLSEMDPPRPSTRFSGLGEETTTIAEKRRATPAGLQRALRGDLDWIVMKALEKDRTRRYGTALALADDLRRHLRHEPVLAGPPTLAYRTSRFLRRRGAWVAAGSVVALAGAAAIFFQVRAVASANEARRQTANRLYFEAMLDSYSRPNDALAKFDEVVRLDPRMVNAKVERAYLLKRENKFEQALAEANALVVADPTLGAGHVLLSQLYTGRDAEKASQHRALARTLIPNDKYYTALALDPGENAPAIQLLSELLAEDGTNFDARWARAWRYFAARDYGRMLKDAEVLTATRPKVSAAWNTQGIALARLRRFGEAEDAIGRAIVLSPNYATTYLNRADVSIKLGRATEALSDCNRAIALEPNHSSAYAQRAWAYIRLRKLEAAEADCRKALELDPRNAWALLRLGTIYTIREQFEKAKLFADEALALEPDNVVGLTDRGQIHHRLGQFQDALADYNRAIELDPTDEVPYNSRGLVNWNLADLPGAESDFKKAIELNGRHHEAISNRARLKRAMNRLPEALEDHDAAIAIAPNAGNYAGRAITRRFAGDDEGAVEDLRKVIALVPVEGNFCRLWVYEIARLRQGPDDAALASEMLDAAASAASKAPNEWSKLVVRLFHDDDVSEGTLLAAADNDEKRCEALYYLGSHALIAGRRDEARNYFSRCTQTKLVDFGEYDLARWHLTALSR